VHPQYRETFEDYFIKMILSKQKKELSLVSFGAGFLFQDIRVLSRIAKNAPSSLYLHFIDKTYVSLVLFLALLQRGNTFDAKFCGDILYRNV
jgi:hypothetical protein